MKTIRIIATLLVLVSLIGLVVSVFGIIEAHIRMSQQNTEPVAIAYCIAIALSAMWVSHLFFPIGVAIHGIIAHKTQTYSRRIWFLMVVISILFCFSFPVGTIIGGITIVLLYTLDIFRKMKASNQASQPIARQPPGSG